MSLSNSKASTDNRTRLAHALGFTDYPRNTIAVPYVNYILKQHAGSEEEEDYVDLFVKIVRHFQTAALENGTSKVATVQSIIDDLVLKGFRKFFADTALGDVGRKELVEDTVMCMLGTWATMLSSFQNKRQCRKVVAAHRMFADQTRTHTTAPMMTPGTTFASPPTTLATYDHSLSGLIAGSGLLPGAKWDQGVDMEADVTMKFISLMLSTSNIQNQNSLQHLFAITPRQDLPRAIPFYATSDNLGVQESLSISAKRLNAFTLNVLSEVDVLWTPNVSRHLLLTNVGGRHILELFSLPCAFGATTCSAVGISWELQQEIEESYAILFNAWFEEPLHVRLGASIGIRKVCWCWSCCAYRYRQRSLRACRSRVQATQIRKINSASNPIQEDFDPALEVLMMKDSMSDWTPWSFPSLWPRIVRLEEHFQSSRPWSLWVLFRDRRDTLQFWTFLFATAVLFLTAVQVLLGIAQVVGSFK